MTDQTKTPRLAGRGGEGDFQKHPGKFTQKTRPAYSRTFRPDENSFAIVCVGWPPVRPPAPNVLALPPDTAPAAVDWRVLKGCHVFVLPPPGATAPHDLLRSLGAELARVGAASMVLFDGLEVASEFWRAASERPGGVA